MNAALPIVEPENATEAGPELTTYAYSYPHKSSYRPLDPPVPITEAWRREDASRLSLYVHVPFCEMRCGFCNLFTQSRPEGGIVEAYLATLARQMRVVREAVPQATFRQLALGGGTPTYLSAAQLESVFARLESTFEVKVRDLDASVEVSPTTVSPDRLGVLADFGVKRISIGVQSFLGSETKQIGRPQRHASVATALDRIRASGFPVLNIDLIYGDPEQTRESWLASIREALRYRPEELYLYPLYVRPGTGLARVGWQAARHRDDLYVAGRDLLIDHGYEQASLRCFRWPREQAPSAYGCQRDGMIGLGCGARSYTQGLHYSSRFSVNQAGVRAILEDWVRQPDRDLAMATHGIRLDADEQLRRFLILSLLQAEGMTLAEFAARFPGSDPEDMPEVRGLIERGWLLREADRLVLSPEGLQHSDTVGPLLYSPPVRERLREFVR